MRQLADAPSEKAVMASKVVGDDLALALATTIVAIEEARLRVADHLAALALAPRVVNRLEVVLEELISNVIRHGFDDAAIHAMLLRVGARPHAIVITLEDDGRPFNPFEVAEPPAFESLETARIGGLGIPVVRRFSTATRYEAAPESPLWEDLVKPGARPANRVTVEIARTA
jgi:anti-sigma regulatory factor (Ser/Thr protein kinase)